MPVGNGGKFTKEAGEIYDLVLQMQSVTPFSFFFGSIIPHEQAPLQECMSQVKPGAHWDSIHAHAHAVLVRGFLKLGIFKPAAEDELLREGAGVAFFPHGLGHSLGLDVHDVPSASKPLDTRAWKIPSTNDALHTACFQHLRLRLSLEEGMVVVSFFRSNALVFWS